MQSTAMKKTSLVIAVLVLLMLMMRSCDSMALSNGQLRRIDKDGDREKDGRGRRCEAESLTGAVQIFKRAARVPVNVESFGAVGDGVADDTQAFQSAWQKACSTRNAVFLVPGGRRYKVNATMFRGPCQRSLIVQVFFYFFRIYLIKMLIYLISRIIYQVSGAIVAPDEPKNWDPQSPRKWLAFSKLRGVKFQGGGMIDGSGSKWWAASCKIKKTNPCKGAPTALTIDSSSAIMVKNLTIQFAQQMHFTISRSEAIRVSGVRILAPEDSPNTDGIHITRSTNVAIQNCHIGTGDDCVSIVNASSNIKMKNIKCGPGHGISIGSLGKGNSAGMVTGVVLDTAMITGTTNGLRIKTWQVSVCGVLYVLWIHRKWPSINYLKLIDEQGGSGYVKSVRFENVKMIGVKNPIIINQFYCDSPITCKNQTSAVKISEVIYRNISGTSRTPKAMTFACSSTVPCSNIVLNNINLRTGDGTAETFCNCAMGFDYGTVQPKADCLKSSSCGGVQYQKLKPEPTHTEL
ncbi:hypothetical protein Cni_G12969 [Canna indica]|uniref:Polygalacturonase n=1 Tax=Canna indica TaxID=4628 RepID=A0AAQ3K8S1_9LILI|nr:hypothetical protein Cni_G12969 [Canna indica]